MLAALLAVADPAFANKFESIGGGVSGSVHIKKEWLFKLFAAAGGISLFGAVLAVVIPHNNALFLNFQNWKRSAIVLTILAIVFFVAAVLI